MDTPNPTILRSPTSENSEHSDPGALEEGEHPVVQEVRGRDRCLSVLELGEAHLRVGIDEGLLVDPSHALQGAHVEGVLIPAAARVLALELTVGLPSAAWPSPALGAGSPSESGPPAPSSSNAFSRSFRFDRGHPS